VDFTGAEDNGGDGGNSSYMTCNAPVGSSPPTNQHSAYYRPDADLMRNERRDK